MTPSTRARGAIASLIRKTNAVRRLTPEHPVLREIFLKRQLLLFRSICQLPATRPTGSCGKWAKQLPIGWLMSVRPLTAEKQWKNRMVGVLTAAASVYQMEGIDRVVSKHPECRCVSNQAALQGSREYSKAQY